MVRGGKNLNLILKANIVQPDAIIEEDKFDFEGICFNEMKSKKLTLSINLSYHLVFILI